MHTSGSSSTPFGTRKRILFVALLAVALSLLTGCSGSSSPNYPTPTTQNPAPGVTLQAIKITPSNSSIPLAASRQLFATGIYNDGSSVDITSQVSWSASSQPSTTNFVTVNSSGVATASSVGTTVISATVGPVVGVLQMVVDTNGFTSSTMAVLTVPFKTSQIDVGYMPLQSQIQGAYAVQEVNLDADQFSSVLPVPLALKASIPMPAGFMPNATAASQNTSKVAVISYTSPNIQIIDGSNNPLDLNSNTLIATFAAPVSQSVTINGIACMICAAVVNPLNDQLFLSTAQGFYSMDMTSGKFTAMPFTPAPLPTANFTIDAAAASPFILSTNPGSGAVQILSLTTNAVTTYNNVTPVPATGFVDLITNQTAIMDGSTNEFALADLSDPQNPQFFSNQTGLGVCPGGSDFLNMVAIGVPFLAQSTNPTLLISQTGGNCVGLGIWPAPSFPFPGQIGYGYGPMPPTPDGNPFVNGNDPNTIATFTSVVDKKNYGVLVDANQQWIAKINFANAINISNIGGNNALLPTGALNNPPLSAGIAGAGIVFLPTPITNLIVSTPTIDFGTLSVGTLSPQVIVTVTNIGTGTLSPQISIQGANAGDFAYITNCSTTLLTQSNCPVYVTFTPTATGVRSATLNVGSSGVNTQSVALTGTGQ